MPNSIRRLVLAAVLITVAAFFSLSLFPIAAALSTPAEVTLKQGLAWRDHGADSLVITLHVDAANRLKLREILQKEELARLEHFKAIGMLRSYRVLFSRYDDSTWDAMLLLDFTSDRTFADWKSVEAKTPAGLPQVALKMAKDVQTQPVDRVLGDAPPTNPQDPAPVFLVVPYDVITSADEYIRYAHGYIGPQAKEWVDAGAIGAYDLYVSRYPVGRAWSALMFYAYKGDAGLARRDAVSQSARDTLMQDANWKALNEGKMKLRSERAPVIADILH